VQLSTVTIDGRIQEGFVGYIGVRLGMGTNYPEPLVGDALMLSPSLLELGYQYIQSKWESIVNAGILRPVAEEASKYTSDQYLDFTIEPYHGVPGTLYMYLKDGRRIRINDIGKGIQNYVLARILYEYSKPDVLLWEDYEAHFNPLLLLGVADWLSSIVDSGKQVILSTHSLEAVTIIAQTCENAKVVFLSLEDGILKTKEFTIDDIVRLREAGIDIRMAKGLIF